MALFTAHETAADWSPTVCKEVESAFARSNTATAAFDAGLVLERCDDHAGAAVHYERALDLDPKMTAARVRLVVARYETSHALDEAITALEQIVTDAEFHDVDALIALAVLERKRGAAADLEAARTNLGRALAVDETSMVALNELSLLYVQTNHLDAAALVASQAIDRHTPYAPIFNTAGLVQSKLGKPSLAASMFQRAIDLNPRLFEAYANLGNLNLSFRGFAKAEEAFRKAVALRPNDYDAHLGLALALRGQITGLVTAAKVAAVRAELATCMKIAPDRPDAYFNDGILAEEFDVKLENRLHPALEHAIARFGQFKSRAAGNPAYADAIKRANEGIEDATATGRSFP
jgi:tetratricopeptide (TPR) repeat protein